jgi:hypothetical protein
MNVSWKRTLVAAVLMLAAGHAYAQAAAPARQPILLGTTGSCLNNLPGGPCTATSTLVQLDPQTGALIRTIGPVGFTVNGLAWDRTSGKLYASTAIGDVSFHGLITINPFTGVGTPVNPKVVNFGLGLPDSPVHSIAIDFFGNMVGWYDEFPPPAGVTDTFVRINKRTGVATEFQNTGIDTFQNGVAFQQFGPLGVLWNMDAPHANGAVLTQNAYVLNPFNGKPIISRPINPPTVAALGDFHPQNHRYYGLKFAQFDPVGATNITVIDPLLGTAKDLGPTADFLHVIAFVK